MPHQKIAYNQISSTRMSSNLARFRSTGGDLHAPTNLSAAATPPLSLVWTGLRDH